MAIFCVFAMIIYILIPIFLAFIFIYAIFPIPPKPHEQQYDTAIVLGYPSNADGSLSSIQKKRMDVAIRLFKKNKIKSILISGSNAHNKFIESRVMGSYAIKNKIPNNHIIFEETAKNTYENFKNAKKICDEKNYEKIIVITSPSHIRRASFFAKKFFIHYTFESYKEKFSLKKAIDEYFRMWNTLYFELKFYLKNNTLHH